jgi:hypothetical protein
MSAKVIKFRPALSRRPPARRRRGTLHGLGADKTIPEGDTSPAPTSADTATAELAAQFTAEEQAALQTLGQQYDAAQPKVSFAKWLTDQGQGALLSHFRAYLTVVGMTDLLSALDETPEAAPLTGDAYTAMILDKWDAPKDGGPWALDVNGDWYTVTNPAPDSSITRGNIYVPGVSGDRNVLHEIPQAEIRFTDAKHRAVNRAVLKWDLPALFFDIAPRGGGPEGIGAGRFYDGTPDDYNWEGGNVYPGLTYDLKGADGVPVAQKLVGWWAYRGWSKPEWGGTNNLDLDWMRVYTAPDGTRKYKPWTREEFNRWLGHFELAHSGYTCPQGDINEGVEHVLGKQAERQRDINCGPLNSHLCVWPIDPIAQCMPTSSSRRRKAIKKAAAIAAVVVGAVFLGPAIAGALKGAAAKIGALGIGKAVTASIPKVVDLANAKQTIDAVRNGEVPPPPISLQGDNFKDYAASVAQSLLQREAAAQQQQVSEAQLELQRQQLVNEITRLQQGGAALLPPGSPSYPVPALRSPILSTMEGSQAQSAMFSNVALLAAMVVGGLLIARAR